MTPSTLSEEKRPMADPKSYIESLEWLPTFMRDFHDQKDLFKTIAEKWPNDKRHDISWIDAQVYVIDRFLRFMAFHGYTLQKTRKRKVKFGNIYWTLQEATTQRAQQVAEILNGHHAETTGGK